MAAVWGGDFFLPSSKLKKGWGCMVLKNSSGVFYWSGGAMYLIKQVIWILVGCRIHHHRDRILLGFILAGGGVKIQLEILHSKLILR